MAVAAASTGRGGLPQGDDLSALTWVHAELRRSLEAAHKALRRHLKEAAAIGASDVDAVDPAVLRQARNTLHQGVGALELIDMPAAAQVLRGSETAVQRMVGKPSLVTLQAVEAIERSSFALLDFLARQLAGKPVSPLLLFPAYRSTQQLAGADRVHPADLWKMPWQWREVPPDRSAQPRRADDSARGEMESLVLALMRQPDGAALSGMSDFCADLAAGSAASMAPDAAHLATFWQLASAMFEAQAVGLLASDVYVKRIASRLLAQLRMGSRGQPSLSDRLAQDMLFFCMHASPPTAEHPAPRLAAVRRTWRLDREVSADYEATSLGRFDPAVVALARKRVAGAKDVWSAVAGGELHRLASLGEVFSLVGDSAQRLFPKGERLADALHNAGARTAAGAAEPPPPLAMEVATSLLYLDACIEDAEFDQPDLAQRIEHLAERIDAVSAGADPQPLEPWMEELYRRVSDRQTMGSVVQELRASLSEVEKRIDQFFRQPSEREGLIPVPAQLNAMRGVLSVLGLSQASQAVLHMRNDVDGLAQTEIDPERIAQAGTFDRVADNLGALSFLIDMLSVQPALAKSLFRFDPETGVLSAVMGQTGRTSVFGGLDDSAAAPEPPMERSLLPSRPLGPSLSSVPLTEQVQSLAAVLVRPEIGDDEVLQRLERLSQQALAADEPELARTLGGARVALRTAADAGTRRGLRDELSQGLYALAPPPALGTIPGALPGLPAGVPTPAGAPQNLSAHASPGDDAEMREIFLEEAAEVLADSHAALARLGDSSENAADLTVLRRAFHTLKGSGRMVGLNDFGEAAWSCEQLYNHRLAAQPLRMDGPLRQFTLAALHYLAGWTQAIAAGRDDGHRAADVSAAADALRLHGKVLPIPARGPADVALSTHAFDALLPGIELDGFVSMGPAAAPLPALPVFPPDDAERPLDLLHVQPDDSLRPAWVPPSGDLASHVPDLPTAADLDLRPLPETPAQPQFEIDLDSFGDSQPLPALPPLPAVPALPIPEPQLLTEVMASREFANLQASWGLAPADRAMGETPPPVDAGEPLTLDLTALENLVVAERAAEPQALGAPAPEAAAAADAMMSALVVGWVPDPVEEAVEEPVEEPAEGPVAEVQAAPTPEPAEEPQPAPQSEPQPEPEPELAPEPVIEPEPEPEPVIEQIPVPAVEPVLEPIAQVEDEQVRVIGHLRIGIPLFNIFLNEADEQSRRLGTELAVWGMDPERPPLPDSSIALAHSLAGNSATVGHSALSALGRALEHALMRSQAVGSARDGEAELFNDAADEIRRLLHQFAAGFLRPVAPALMERLADHERWPAPVDASSTTAHAALAELPESEPELQPAPEPEPALVSAPPTAALAAPLFSPSFEPLSAAAPSPQPALAAHARPDAFDDDQDIDALDSIDTELFPIFEEEADELLPQLQSRLRDWVAHPGDLDAASACMRTLHTFKGGARLAGAMRLGEMAHRLETAIEHLVARQPVHADDVEPLLARADSMATAFAVLCDPEFVAPAPVVPASAVSAAPATVIPAADPAPLPAASPLVDLPSVDPQPQPDALADVPAAPPLAVPAGGMAASAAAVDWARFAGSDAPAMPVDRGAAGGAAVRVRAGLLDRMVNQAGEMSITRARIDADVRVLQASLGELTDSLERMRKQLHDIELQAETQISSRMEAAKAASQAFDPLEMDRFTRFQELTRFMAESVNDVATLQRSLQRTLQSTEDELAAQARLTRGLQDDLLRTRMVEFESLADRLYRTVRQAAKETGKQVRLDIVGGAIEVDRGVLERMVGPFEHLLRNSVVHGIEPAAQRLQAGKPADGHISVQVSQAGNEVAIEFGDDGGGLDLQRIRQRGIERGLIGADSAASDLELSQLIFAPGFSTADSVTELAGRGVGMDVVRTEVGAMGGRIEIASSAGQGTRFRLLLPLTTAVTQVVMLRCGVLSVAVPSTLVEVVRRVGAPAVQAAYASGSYEFADQPVPFFWLASLFEPGARGDTGTRSQHVVIVRSASQRVALHVDEVVGNQEVVVKNVGPQLARLPGLVGVTLLPSGVVSLIYNPVGLAAMYAESARRQPAPGPAADVGDPAVPAAATSGERLAPLVMVVDDSLTVRRVTQRLLVREGYRVSLAKDGLEALERLAEERPVVLLSDIEMPRMDGFDLLRNVRADERLAGLPVVMITSRIAQKHHDYAIELGVDHYLGKPYSEELLLSLVARYAGAGRPAVTAPS